ncbi:MAG: DUF6798 domain-containing protein [Pirellulales bacterium]
MHNSLTANGRDTGRAASRRRALAEIALVFLVLFIEGAWPAPDANEPHYLSKARHYWDAGWCPDDFFLNSADAHQVFYWTFGWLSRVLPLGALAWCGRMATWWLLAWAWRRLSWALVPANYYAVLSAALLVTLVGRFSMAGEWLVGGVEAKGFAYVFVLLGLEALVRSRWGPALLLFGAASAFHVVIGGWAVVGAGVVWLASSDRPPLARLVLPLAGGLALALPGLWPALALSRNVDPQVVSEANRIYVYERLYHHLVPQQFGVWFTIAGWQVLVVARHLALIGALVILVWLAAPMDARYRRLCAFVAAMVGVAAVGMLIAMLVPVAPDLAAALLRFYWFRMSDVIVPVGAALLTIEILERYQRVRPTMHAAGVLLAVLFVAANLGATISWRQRHLRPPADAYTENLHDWREMCDWVQANTPPDAVFLTPRLAQTFRWYAERAEVVNRKDIPQDAAGIVEWWQRNVGIHRADDEAGQPRWRASLAELGSVRLRELGRRYGAGYVITTAEPPLALPRVGPPSASYEIYRLADESPAN